MSELKKAVLGGYRRKAVDARLAELQQRLDEAEADRQRYRHEVESAESRVAELERTAADWQSKAAQLEEKLSLLDAMAQPAPAPTAAAAAGDGIFGNIARIYERAYGTGHQIVCDSKETALALLNGLEQRFDEVMGASAETIRQYEALNRNVQELYVTLSHRISDVADSTSHMLKQAKDFYGVYGELKEGVASARDNAAALLGTYEDQAAEFLGTGDKDDAPAASTDPVDAPTASTDPVDAPAAPAEPEMTTAQPDTPAAAAAETAAEPTAPTTEPIDAPAAPPETEPSAAADPAAVKPPIRMVVSPAAKAAGEFTQFGRKSRISPEERSELLRKALLRNGGG